MTRLEKIKAAHEEMDRLMTSLASVGAADSEPDWHYQLAVKNALHGRPFESMNATGWELYSNSKGAPRAASKLNAQARKVTNLILKARVQELNEIRQWVIQNFWRVDIE